MKILTFLIYLFVLLYANSSFAFNQRRALKSVAGDGLEHSVEADYIRKVQSLLSVSKKWCKHTDNWDGRKGNGHHIANMMVNVTADSYNVHVREAKNGQYILTIESDISKQSDVQFFFRYTMYTNEDLTKISSFNKYFYDRESTLSDEPKYKVSVQKCRFWY